MRSPSAKRKRAKSRTSDAHSEEQLQLLARLKDLAEATGLEVREEKLMREAGYSVHSGLCRVNGQEVLILDRNVPPHDRIEVAVGVLAGRDLDSIYIEPAMREFLGGGAAPPLAAPAETEPRDGNLESQGGEPEGGG